MKILNGIRSETVRRKNPAAKFGVVFFGRNAFYENGKRIYSIRLEIERLSRGDALRDAIQAAHDVIIQNGGIPSKAIRQPKENDYGYWTSKIIEQQQKERVTA